MFGIDSMTWVMIAIVLALVIYAAFELYIVPRIFRGHSRAETRQGSGGRIANADG